VTTLQGIALAALLFGLHDRLVRPLAEAGAVVAGEPDLQRSRAQEMLRCNRPAMPTAKLGHEHTCRRPSRYGRSSSDS
jgi:hypothetical protein